MSQIKAKTKKKLMNETEQTKQQRF